MEYYPEVVGELETLKTLVAGASIARYGDGEFKMCEGASIKCEVGDARIQQRLREILKDPGECLVGIPNIYSKTPKIDFWGPHIRFRHLLSETLPYYSSFITRPDSAPWINDPAYWALVESLWKGLDVTLVRGSHRSFRVEDFESAASLTEILAPAKNAWAEYDSLMERIGTPKRCLICLGPTGTVMAADLCAKGVHAIDCGHLGMFWRKHLQGLPMWVTKEEKVMVP